MLIIYPNECPKILLNNQNVFSTRRDCAVKFNDYFEFPREFDLEPFTVDGLAKIEGEVIEDDDDSTTTTTTTPSEHAPKDTPTDANSSKAEEEASDTPDSTIYRLMGVVVHSGQASGGHYYSYIIPRWGSFFTFFIMVLSLIIYYELVM